MICFYRFAHKPLIITDYQNNTVGQRNFIFWCFELYFALLLLAMECLFCISYSANVYAVLSTCILIKPKFTERKTELRCVLFKPSEYSESNYICCSDFENVIPFCNFRNDLFILGERH